MSSILQSNESPPGKLFKLTPEQRLKKKEIQKFR